MWVGLLLATAGGGLASASAAGPTPRYVSLQEAIELSCSATTDQQEARDCSLSAIWDRIQGRALGSLIRPGMRAEQVTAILGPAAKPLPSVCATGAMIWSTQLHARYGVTVVSQPDASHVWRVTEVRIAPLFGH